MSQSSLQRAHSACSMRSSRVTLLLVLLACSWLRASAVETDADWTKYADGELEMPRSATWREKMRKQLQSLNPDELTPALKMKRVQLFRKFDAEDARPPPADGAYSNFEADLSGMTEEPTRPPPIQFSLEQVMKGGVLFLIVAVAISYFVPNLQQIIMGAGQSSVSQGRRSRGARQRRPASQEGSAGPEGDGKDD
eukprot:TRINITY_DN69585_c0_g1_i1.p1 TRINITY_DN69585_c0_g1~~TRINITY_DN69585_c0_g1_i1.p1  ORF type:complete len:206 (-),score=36.23 TRINITY_DN69585_c0_g1_i1:41-625(-)